MMLSVQRKIEDLISKPNSPWARAEDIRVIDTVVDGCTWKEALGLI